MHSGRGRAYDKAIGIGIQFRLKRLIPRSPLHPPADVSLLRLRNDLGRGDHVLDPQAERFEERDLARIAAARLPAEDHRPELAHVRPLQDAGIERLAEIPRLELALLLAVDDDAARSPHRRQIDFRLAQKIRADRVDVRSFVKPIAIAAPDRGYWWR